MKLLAHVLHVLCLCSALALTWAEELVELGTSDHTHEHGHDHEHGHGHVPDRCDGLEMDAVTVNVDGVPYFFKGEYLFKGFHGLAEPSNETLNMRHGLLYPRNIDAAFHVHHEENPLQHHRMMLFVDDKVFSFHQSNLEEGYPKEMKDIFPGIPDHLDAAVECPKADCGEDSVVFFKGHEIFHFNLKTKAVEEKEFESMPNCTSAFRFMEHYYCFHGHMFSKFDPKTGAVHGKYPKEARDFFMRCSKFSDDSDHVERERCSRVHLDAISSDADGNIFAFRGHHYLHKDGSNDTLNAGLIESVFKEMHSDVDAVLTHNNHFYMIKDNSMFVYKVGEQHTLVDGYPKPLKDELGFDGPVDAAFTCGDHIGHFIKGPNMISVNMTSHSSMIEHPVFTFKKVDAAMCHNGEVEVIVGNHFYNFANPMAFVTGVPVPEQHKVSMELFGCDH